MRSWAGAATQARHLQEGNLSSKGNFYMKV